MSSSNSLKCVCWNIDGLASKLLNDDIIQYVRTIDIVCLIETFLDDTFDLTNHFCDFCEIFVACNQTFMHGPKIRRSTSLS